MRKLVKVIEMSSAEKRESIDILKKRLRVYEQNIKKSEADSKKEHTEVERLRRRYHLEHKRSEKLAERVSELEQMLSDIQSNERLEELQVNHEMAIQSLKEAEDTVKQLEKKFATMMRCLPSRSYH